MRTFEIRKQKSETGKPMRGTAAHALLARMRFFACTLALLFFGFSFLTSAFAATHVTATYGLPPNPNVMATAGGTPEYGLVFVERDQAVTWNGTEYAPTTMEGYLNASGELNDGAGNLYLDLVPDSDASPQGSYYVVTVNIQGQVHSEIWTVPDQTSVDATLIRQTQTPGGAGAATFYQTVENAGAALAQRQALNFSGTGVSCADDSAMGRTDCTITAGSGSGSGTVTNFSAGGLAPLFGASVANATTTPALTFTLSNAPADSWFGNATGASAAPAFNTSAIPASLIPALNYQSPLSSYAAPSHEFLTGFTSPDTFAAAQPAFADLSGSLADAQLPADAAKFTGTITADDCAKWSSSGVLADAGAACGTGGGSSLPLVTPESDGAAGNGASYFDGSLTANVADSTASGVSTSPSAPAITTSVNNSVVLAIFGIGATWSSAPSTGTQRVNQVFASGGYGLTVNDQTAATAGSVPAVSGTLSASQGWNAGSLALEPTAGNTISFVNAASSEQTSAVTTISVSTPSGAANGDFYVACVEWYGWSGNVETISAFPSVGGIVPVFSINDGQSDNLDCHAGIFSGTPPASFSWTQTSGHGGSGMAAAVLVYSNVTGADLQSATSNFASGDVGDPICVAGATAAGGQACGTIQSFTSSSQVSVSFASSVTASNLWFTFGTNDDSAFSTMLTSAPCSTVGCHVLLAPRTYILTKPLSLPADIPIQITGAGSGVANSSNDYLGTVPVVDSNAGTRLVFDTLNLGAAAIAISGSVGLTSTTASDRLAHLTIYGGAGKARDGGGANGVNITNWQDAALDDVAVANFSGNGVYIDGLAASSYKDYIEDITLNKLFSFWNGGKGVQVGSTLGVDNIETVAVNNSIIENNGGPGVGLDGANIQAFSMTNTVLQWNNINAAAPELEIATPAAPTGCEIRGDYFEADTNLGSQSNNWVTPGSSCNFGSNHVYWPAQGTPTLVTASSDGTLKAVLVQSHPQAFAALPGCSSSNEGASAAVTDSATNTWGATISGGGSDHVLGYCDGTHWTVEAK